MNNRPDMLQISNESRFPGTDLSQGQRWYGKIWAQLVLFKIGYFGLVLIVAAFGPGMDVQRFFGVMQHWPREGGPTFGSHFATWDAAHYLFLSEVGYQQGSPSCAFYPLWPMLIRAGSWVTFGNHLWSALLLANALSILGLVLIYRLVRSRYGDRTARWSVALLLAFPGALFLQFPYSEPLFLTLITVLWVALARGRYDWAALAGFFLPLTRAVGFLCGLGLLYHLIRRRRPVRDYLALAGFACGGLAYFLFMKMATGNPLEGFAAQKSWPVNSLWNIVNVPKFFNELLLVQDWHIYHGSMLDRLWFVGLACGLPAIYRLDREAFVWTLLLGVFPAMISSFVSFTRYALMAVPVFVVIAVSFDQDSKRWVRWYLFTLFSVVHLILLVRHINFQWAG